MSFPHIQLLRELVVLFCQTFIANDVTFAVKPYFRGPFCSDDVREGLAVEFVRHVIQSAKVSTIPLTKS